MTNRGFLSQISLTGQDGSNWSISGKVLLVNDWLTSHKYLTLGRTDRDRPTDRCVQSVREGPNLGISSERRRGNPSLPRSLARRTKLVPTFVLLSWSSSLSLSRHYKQLPCSLLPSPFLFPIPPSSHPLTHSQQKAHIFIPRSERATDTGWAWDSSFEIVKVKYYFDPG